jgi:SAM-dependent methyltransferase
LIDFQKEYFDIIWAEGSIFIIGFETGLKEWKKFVKSDGYIAIHEMTWLKKDPPKEIYDYWQEVYPAISTIDDNLKIIEKCGYKILGHFPLPDDAWWEFYYDPLQIRLKDLKVKYKDNSEALELIAETDKEIDLFKKYNQWYGSVFYVMQKQS